MSENGLVNSNRYFRGIYDEESNTYNIPRLEQGKKIAYSDV